MSILVGFLPSITARRPIAAPAKVAKAFEAYEKAGRVQKASALARKRYRAEIDNKVPLEDIARYEVGGFIAILVNSAPAAFWTLFLLYSHPSLLDDIRKEIDACTEAAADDGSTVKTIDIIILKEAFPPTRKCFATVPWEQISQISPMSQGSPFKSTGTSRQPFQYSQALI